MKEETKAEVTILYTNGTKQKFEFPRQEDTYNIAARIHEALKANQILLELEDRVLVIPFQNIQSLEIKPPPAKLPPNAIRNVRIVG